MKIISPKLHGIIDYLVVAFLLASPSIFGFMGHVALFTYALAGVHLLLTILTNYSAGIVKIIPLPVHGLIEFIVGLLLIIMAFTLLNNHPDVKHFYTVFGAAILVVFLITDYKGVNTGNQV
ncbi:MAG TPA: hypothetical protein VNW95_11625 [Mucilaginibacter sp.]|jgi:hypothetical protein|nr:hypothetical protein [Mucilaginibacter sp.]